MNKAIFYILILSIIFIDGCKIKIKIIYDKEEPLWEKVEDFRVDLNTKPSDLISEFTSDSNYKTHGNYFLTFFTVTCPHSLYQVNYCNNLYRNSKDDFKWIAFTIEDSTFQKQFIEKHKLPQYYYEYKTYYNINGLKSSLLNLYYKNDEKIRGFIPVNMIIVNDSIVKIFNGAVNSKSFEYYENYIDSVSKVIY